ncbi:MAG TPA: hypothetical protein VFS21_19965 [Roseiflexaceae bacterium]|nr:hypothetical protein [Roseiflexaceae bacterium]
MQLKRLTALAGAAGALVLLGLLALRPATPTASGPVFLPAVQQRAFAQQFAESPARPQPWQPADWDISIHSRDVDTWTAAEPMHAGHGPDCGAPPASHALSSYEQAVYVCRRHVMTALNATGYGVIYLTPAQQLDFSQGDGVVRFNLSTLRTSGRDWIDLWVTPYADQLQLPLDTWLPDLSGVPRNAVHIRMDLGTDRHSFKAELIRDFQVVELPQADIRGYEQVLTPSAQRRDTFELRLGPEHVAFGMPQYGLWWIDAPIPRLDWGRGVVQFGHHSYNPTKGCDGCRPNTWHWSDFYIGPAAPFTIIRADRRTFEADDAPLTLERPAPAGAHLRFAGIGDALEVSFDGGDSWQPAELQAQRRLVDEHFRSYWMPIPAGVKQVAFRGRDWWGGPWMIRDTSVWKEQP